MDQLQVKNTRTNMNILVITWKWMNTGGDWTYTKNLVKLYSQMGHNVISLSMDGDLIDVTNEKHFTIKPIDFGEINKNKSLKNILYLSRTIFYNTESKEVVKKILTQYDISLIHLHNIRNTVTLSFLDMVNHEKTKVVWTLHDYNLLCPDTHFVRNNQVCELCKDHKYYNALFHKCKKGSLGASMMAMLSSYYHYIKKFNEQVDLFLCPSQFIMNKFIEFGYPPEKMTLSNYCFDIENFNKTINLKNSDDQYIAYVGRLEKIKGIKTLLYAMEELPNIHLRIIGGGTAEQELRNFVESKEMKNIEFLGKLESEKVYEQIQNSKFVVIPSEWYENYPFSIIESMLLKKPVIGSDIGGIPELVIHNVTGLLFQPGNNIDLKNKIQQLYNKNTVEMGERAYVHVNSIVNYENHSNVLKNIFKKINIDL